MKLHHTIIASLIVVVVFVFVSIGALGQSGVPIAKFKTETAFWAGNAKMPAGTYSIFQSSAGDVGTIIFLRNEAGTHEAFLDVAAITSMSSHQAGDVVFDKLGTTEFFSAFYLPPPNSGPTMGYQALENNYEKALEKSAKKTQHSLPSTKPK